MTSADLAASVQATALAIAQAMATYQHCPRSRSQLRGELLVSVDGLHERLSHELLAHCRKHKEERWSTL